ncbi:hypothetical protein AUK22_09180 [bacterium CG2_30_54_10]|nr:MAG: hypothetical protein AUK22_09180 [bacterium CG2_30_54_10]
MKLSPNTFAQLRDFLSHEYGLFFEASKVTFLENRILPFIEKLNCIDMNQFIAKIKEFPDQRRELLDALTTNETWFFRHPRHFDILREEILLPLIRARQKAGPREISIWSAGSSIGAETFSIAITVREALLDLPGWEARIIGSDISAEAIQRANKAVFSSKELNLLSPILMNRYFFPQSAEGFKVKPEIRSMVAFERMNLLDPWPNRVFDVIFCRNTMIYFHEGTKATLTERFFQALVPGGTFFTSATETLHWKGENAFEKIFIRGEYVYRKRTHGRPFVLYRFRTPADLLRALNILVKHNFEYQLLNIPQESPNQPRKAIFIAKAFQKKVEEVFANAALKASRREEVIRQ